MLYRSFVFRAFFAIAIGAAIFVVSGPAGAQDQQDRPPLSVATVDVQAVGSQAQALTAARERLDQIRESLQQAFDERAAEIRGRAEELQARQSVMPPNVFQQRQRQLNEQMIALRQQAEAQRNALVETWQEQVLAVFQRTVIGIIQELSVERGYTLVMDRGAALFASPAYDVTEVVVERVNERLPSLEFDFQDPTQEQQGQQ